MRVFVTGATGLLGSNLVRLLAENGHQITALVRSPERAARQLGGLDVRLVAGDMGDVASFASALAGHEVLFHTAAFFREYYQPGDHGAELQRINVDGTMALLRAAEAQGVRRVIYASSSGVIGQRNDGVPADETTPPDALVQSNLYFRSKLLAEQAIAAWLPTSKLEVVQILPGWMFGPGDAAPTSSGQLVLDFLNRRLPLIIPGAGAPVDARDVAQAMLAAVEHGRNGERYLVSSNNTQDFRTLFGLLEELSGVPGPRVAAPYPFALVYAWVSELRGRLTGKPVLATIAGVRSLRHARPTSSAKAMHELKFTQRPLRDTLRDEIAWFRRERLTQG